MFCFFIFGSGTKGEGDEKEALGNQKTTGNPAKE